MVSSAAVLGRESPPAQHDPVASPGAAGELTDEQALERGRGRNPARQLRGAFAGSLVAQALFSELGGDEAAAEGDVGDEGDAGDTGGDVGGGDFGGGDIGGDIGF
jgi:hypothetical protein